MIRGFATIVLLFVTLLSQTSSAAAGESSSGSRGGGDPLAIEFLQVLLDLNAYIQRSSFLFPDERAAVAATTEKIRIAMDDPKHTSIRFTSKILRDDSGTEKVALFSQNPLSIRVNRGAWQLGDQAFKTRLVALELLGLISLPNRYKIVSDLDLSRLELTRKILKTGWDFASIEIYGKSVFIAYPSAPPEPLFSDSQRLMILEKSVDPTLILAVACKMYGFEAAGTGLFKPLSPDFDDSVIQLDTHGGFISPIKFTGDPSKFQVIETLICNKAG